MTLEMQRRSIHHLSRAECLELLAADCIGRLSVISGNTPFVFPVNYVLDGETVMFRTDPGTKLDHGPRSRACFEIDEFDRAARSGWSVIVAGRLEEVTPYDKDHRRLMSLGVEPWAAGDKAHRMRLFPETITGRRIPPRAAGST